MNAAVARAGTKEHRISVVLRVAVIARLWWDALYDFFCGMGSLDTIQHCVKMAKGAETISASAPPTALTSWPSTRRSG